MTRVRSSVPWALLLPVVTTALFLLWWTQRDGRRNAPPFTPLVSEVLSVEGWSAAVELGAGRGRLSVRLWPLHAVPEVQAFDAAALARRLELEPGEPWLAELSWKRAVGTRGGDSDAAQRSRPAAELGVERLGVHDPLGRALAPLAPATAAVAEDRPADPLAVLLAPPLEGLGPDQSLSVLLWGRRPEGPDRPESSQSSGAAESEPRASGWPRLAGLRWSTGEELAPLVLEPATHVADALPRDLARLGSERAEDPTTSGVR